MQKLTPNKLALIKDISDKPCIVPYDFLKLIG
jgi:hypothetical protein